MLPPACVSEVNLLRQFIEKNINILGDVEIAVFISIHNSVKFMTNIMLHQA